MIGKTRATLIVFLVLCSLLVSLTNIEAVRAVEDSWETMAEMPTARSGLGVAVVDGKIYAIGGYLDQISFSGHLGTNEMYDPATDTWETKESMPTARNRFGIAVVQNKIYVIGGETDEGYTGVNEVYDPLTDTWETRTPMPTVRADLSANVVDDKICLIGGTEIYGYGYWPRTINVTEVYDPVTDSWATKTSIPTAVCGYASAVVDNKIYVIGSIGWGEPSSGINQIYNPETDTWALGSSMPNWFTERAASAATTGVFAPKRIDILWDDEHHVYDPENDSWSTATSMPTSRLSLGVAVVDDILYAIGGGFHAELGFTESNKNEKYTPSGYIPEFPSWTPILITLVAVVAMTVVYRVKLDKQNRGKINR
jgi:N-acetylneuraminic acid mutarotase